MLLKIMEIWSYIQVPIFIYLFKRWANRNIIGDIIAGTIIGCYIEFATEPLWNYHFKLTIYKDIPPAVVFGWGLMFALAVFVSEKLYKFILHKNQIVPYDKRIFIFDLISAGIIGLPIEKFGLIIGIWDYNYSVLGWSGKLIPFFKMPVEALIGYMLLMLFAPSFVRYWQKGFERGG